MELRITKRTWKTNSWNLDKNIYKAFGVLLKDIW